MLVEALRRLGLPFVALSWSVAMAAACTSDAMRQSPAAAPGTGGDAQSAGLGGEAGFAAPDAATNSGATDGSSTVAFPEIITGSLPPPRSAEP